MFDRVVLINLRRRPDRLANFRQQQVDKGWPAYLSQPEIFEAIDGNVVGIPTYFVSGGGAWGCLRSHVNILERALMDKVASVLVFEDDVCWLPTLSEKLQEFMSKVPNDWDQLMLGGQVRASEQVVVNGKVIEGVNRCRSAGRTHAYAIRGSALKDLLRLWYECNRHCDHVLAEWHRDWKVYSPSPPLFGQDESKSDIGRESTVRFWSSPMRDSLVVWMRYGECNSTNNRQVPNSCTGVAREIVSRLRTEGIIHTGINRDKTDDIDVGLKKVKDVLSLRRWLSPIIWEAVNKRRIPVVWAPQITLAMVRGAHTTGPVVVIDPSSSPNVYTYEECLAQLVRGEDRELSKDSNPTPILPRKNYADEYVILLRSSRDVMEELRSHGWHSGNWRDSITGQDNGLRQVVVKGVGYGEWIQCLSKEARDIPGGVTVAWHPDVTLQSLQSSTSLKVVEIEAKSVREALDKFQSIVDESRLVD